MMNSHIINYLPKLYSKNVSISNFKYCRIAIIGFTVMRVFFFFLVCIKILFFTRKH